MTTDFGAMSLVNPCRHEIWEEGTVFPQAMQDGASCAPQSSFMYDM